MNIENIKARVDAAAAAMSAKGLAMTDVNFTIGSGVDTFVYASWRVGEGHSSEHKSFAPKGESVSEKLMALDIWIEELPSREERRKREFTEGLAALIELGNAAGIEADLVNPLMAAMKKLSENALTNQSVAS